MSLEIDISLLRVKRTFQDNNNYSKIMTNIRIKIKTKIMVINMLIISDMESLLLTQILSSKSL